MKKTKFQRYGVYFLVALIVAVFIGVKLQRNYYYYVIEYSRAMYSPNSVGNPNLVTAGPMHKIDENSLELLLEMRPGESVDTKVYVRNGADVTNSIHLKFSKFPCEGDSCADGKSIDPKWLRIDGLDVNGDVALLAGEVRFMDVDVVVPKDILPGKYLGYLEVNSNRSVQMPLESGAVANVLTSNSSKVTLNVSNEPKEIDYAVSLSDPKMMAIDRLHIDIRQYAAVLFALLALYCVYIAFKKNK